MKTKNNLKNQFNPALPMETPHIFHILTVYTVICSLFYLNSARCKRNRVFSAYIYPYATTSEMRVRRVYYIVSVQNRGELDIRHSRGGGNPPLKLSKNGRFPPSRE